MVGRKRGARREGGGRCREGEEMATGSRGRRQVHTELEHPFHFPVQSTMMGRFQDVYSLQ